MKARREPKVGELWRSGNGVVVRVTWVGWSKRDNVEGDYVLFDVVGHGVKAERDMSRFTRHWEPLVVNEVRVCRCS